MINNISIKNKIIGLIGISILSLVIFSVFLTIRLNTISNDWKSDVENGIIKKQHLLAELHSTIGYGGNIHIFKNYLLRGNKKYLDKSHKILARTREIISEYEQVGGLSEKEISALSLMKELVGRYSSSYEIVRQKKRARLSIHAIDKIVHIEDGPYQEALRTIDAELLRSSRHHSGELNALLGNTKKMAIPIVVIAIGILCLLGFIIYKSITTPLSQTVRIIKEMGDGRFTSRLNYDRSDEIGEIARSMDTMAEKMQSMIGNIKTNASTLSYHSQNLYAASSQMEIDTGTMSSNAKSLAATSGEVSTNVETVATAAEVASANVTNVSAATEEVSNKIVQVASTTKDILSNIHTVAAAIEEMSSTVSEITKNTTTAAGISRDATEKAGEAEVLMRDLSTSAETVGKVIEVINDIADRTNLLALNATIEAASAGEAGKGFAVVANEVKELAKQTAEATKEVVKQIEEMQNNTVVAVEAIDKVASTINDINEINTSIAASVEEQDATTNEISKTTVQTVTDMEAVSHNIEEASLGAEEVARNAAELSSGVSDISNNAKDAATGVNNVSSGIGTVDDASINALNSVKEVHQSIDKLSTVTGNLNDLVGQFIIDESILSGANEAPQKKANRRVRPFIAWSDRYSVGVDIFDAQHKRLFTLINNVHEAMVLGSGREEVLAILGELLDYTNKHFGKEEEEMKKAGYEGYEDQHEKHIKLVEQLCAFKDKCEQGNEIIDLKLMGFLKDWLTKHIMGTDMKYKNFFKSKGFSKVA